MSIAAQTIASVRVTMAATILTGLVQVAIMVVLARLITPAEYGLVAGALVLVSPLVMILFGGLERALVLQSELPERAVNAVLWGGLAAALITALALSGITMAAAAWLGMQDLKGVLLACTPLLLGGAIGAVFRGLLRRRFAYGRIAAIDLAAQVIGTGAVSIIAALQGWGAYALVAGMLVQSALQALLLGLLAGHGFMAGADAAAARPLLRAGLMLSGTSVLEVIHGRLPSAITGIGLGEAALGLFTRGYMLVQLPAELLANALSRVLLGGMAQVREETERLRRAAKALIESGAAMLLPICAGMAMAAPELILTMLGPQWMEVVPLLPWLCLGTAAVMIGHFFAVLNEAAMRLSERFRIQLSVLLFTGAALIAAVSHGLIVVAAVLAISGVAYALLHLLLAARVLHLPALALLAWLLPGAAAAIACMIAVALLQLLLPGMGALPLLGLDILTCALCLCLVYGLGFRRLFNDLLRYAGLYRG